ncbi:helix-turn-helix domain-containing protein [Streptomyces sp. NPDC047315]|uniref:PucR family transcriptional regulator n=1 Tax=Streptomyces sp. NPDC047315 TaxID=3155142 RepID=UPI0033D2AAB9
MDVRGRGTAGGASAVPRLSLLRTVREVFRSAQDVAGELSAGRHLVLHAASASASAGPLLDRCTVLTELIAERHDLDARVAVGEPGTGVTGMHCSYRDAAAVLRSGPALRPDTRVFPVAEFRVPQLVGAAVRHERTRYAAALLDGVRGRADWPDLRQTLIAWAECGFHLLRTSERLAVHRNTLLYRLAKIDDLTGRDVREPRTAMALYLACIADVLES